MAIENTDYAQLETLVKRIQREADRSALEQLARWLRPSIYRLALRFLSNSDDADDATQEILIRIVTHIGTFRGESAFRTWVYRIATNALLTSSKKRMEQVNWTFDTFAEDLANGLSDEPFQTDSNPERALLLEEVKIGCTLGMLLCLNRNQRMAYILGEILELEHGESADILEVSSATYRKRLSRARKQIAEFTLHHCGLIKRDNACRCSKRVSMAIEVNRVDPEELQYATDARHAEAFPAVLEEIRSLDELRRAAALHRSHALPAGSDKTVEIIKSLIQSNTST